MATNGWRRDDLGLRLVQAAALLLIAFRLVHMAGAGVFMDEAYYWMWGQHPSLSYYDHPPLNAWLLAVSAKLLGWSPLALRAPVCLTLLADIFALVLLSRRIAGTEWQRHFWVTLLLFVATPIYWLVSTLALPDHLLLCCGLFALYFLFSFFADRADGQRGETRHLLLGAFWLGLAGLSKYNAAFIALAIPLYALAADRSLFRDRRVYLAGLLTLAMQAPVIAWNIQQAFASWEFILEGRHSGLRKPLEGLLLFIVFPVIFLSPMLFWPIAKFLVSRQLAAPGLGFARTIFILSTIAIFGVSLVTLILFHWNLVAYIAMLPFLALVMRPRPLLALQAVYGLAFAGLAFFNYAVQPVLDVRAYRDMSTAWSFGWDQTAAAVAAAKAAHPVGFVAAADYTTASLLGFALKDKDVTSLSPRRDAYDYWFDPRAHAGQDAILVGDIFMPISKQIRGLFSSVEQIDSVEVVRAGKPVDRYKIYLARGYAPP